MGKPTLTKFSELGLILVQKYERYLPNAFDESLTLLQKVNKIIEYLNKMGLIVDDLIKQWNEVMEWVLNDGLNEAVKKRLDEMVADGTLAKLINETIFNELNRRVTQAEKRTQGYVSILEYENLKIGEDWAPAFRKAILDVFDMGGGEIRIPDGTYKLLSIEGYVNLPTSDDGTVANSSSITPEPINKMPYSVRLKSGVKIVGSSKSSIIQGNYTYGQADLNQIIGIVPDGEISGSAMYNCGLENLTIDKFFIGYAVLDNTSALFNFDTVKMTNCAIPMYFQVLERCRFYDLEILSCGTGILIGGQWRTRTDNYNEKGGFADKCIFDKITFEFNHVMGINEHNIDTFFDNYFFKTINNTTRLGTPMQPNSVAKLLKYRGICGIMISILPRYWRPSVNNDFRNLFMRRASRYLVYGGQLESTKFSNLNLEDCGYQDGTNNLNPVGVGWNDPYLGDGVRIPSFIVGSNNTCDIELLQTQKCYAKQSIPDNVSYRHLRNYGNSNLEITQPTSNIREFTVDTSSLKNSSLISPLTTNGNRVGDRITSTVKANGTTATTNIPISENLSYIAVVQSKVTGTVANSIMGHYLIHNYNQNGYQLRNVTQIGTAIRSNGVTVPTTLDVTLNGTNLNIVVSVISTQDIQFVVTLLPIADAL